MSDIESYEGTSAVGGRSAGFMDRSIKRRRLSDESATGRYSSPDELGDPSPRRRSRPTPRSRTSLPRTTASNHRDPASLDRSPSPDELDHTYYARASHHEDEDVRSQSDQSERSRERSREHSREHSRNRSRDRTRSRSRDQSRERSLTPDFIATPTDSEEIARAERASPPLKPKKRPQYKLKMVLKGHKKGISEVKFSPDGQYIASGSADMTVRIWEASTGINTHIMEGHLAGISAIAWSPDSQTVASGSDDKTIRLWDRIEGDAYPKVLKGHSSYVYSISFSPKGNMIVSGAYDEAVFLWDARTGRQMKNFPAHSDPVAGVDFTRDGTLVASCGTDGLIRIWDPTSGQCLRTIVHEDNAGVTNVKFSPNGKYVLAWTLDGCIRLWDYVKGVCMKTYQGHRNIRWSVGGAFGVCGDEAFIVSGSEDGRICIWDAKSKAILQEIEDAHDGPVMWVDTHPTLDRLVSCGLDGTLRVWVHVDEEDEKLEDDVMDIAEDEKDDMIRDRNADDVDEVDAEIKEDLIKMEADEIMKDDLDDLDEI